MSRRLTREEAEHMDFTDDDLTEPHPDSIPTVTCPCAIGQTWPTTCQERPDCPITDEETA